MHKANAHMVGVVFAALLGGFHLFWALLIALGVAQGVMDFVLWAHMIHLTYIVGPFDLTAAIALVVMTAVIGYVAGWIGGVVWNKVHGI